MYKIVVPTEKDKYYLSELAKMFVPASELNMISRECAEDGGICESGAFFIPTAGDKLFHGRLLYEYMREQTGRDLDWGILTGVRPEKLYRQLSERMGQAGAESFLRSEYMISEPKLALLRRIYEVQRGIGYDRDPRAAGIYIGIPFCPTRCIYCAFTSNKITKRAAVLYIGALLKEMAAVSEIMEKKGMYAESVYIGGGTPTSLDEDDFETMLSAAKKAFISEKTKEFTVEAGRPDTINGKKLDIIKNCGADRISINPQSMKQRTLELIGRSHTPEQIREAFALAKEKGFEHINADLIAGLPEEIPEDFEKSLKEVIDLKPSNITVHTLAVKKASRLIERDADYAFRQADNVRAMLDIGAEMLRKAGYEPYYLYRQKHMAGNFENVGYAKPKSAGLYNIRIMEENQSIIALGAGGISKIYYSEEDRLERIPNVSNYEIYIDRIDEMIERKRKGME